jgi:2-oxoglutarate dehydrogenase E1 component
MELIPSTLSLSFVEGLYTDYLRDPASVPADWRQYFDQLAAGGTGSRRAEPGQLGPSFRPSSLFNPPSAGRDGDRRTPEPATAALQHRVDQLIRSYRVRGHMIAELDPLGRARPAPPELDPAYYGFTAADLDRILPGGILPGVAGPQSLRQIIERLRNTYCRWIGAQFMHIDDLEVREWLQERMERTENRLDLSRQEQLRILTRLTDAVIFEEFIRKKFVGAKSFSLEGSESLIPLLDLAIEKAGEQGIAEIVLAMAHRGRLNVLANIVGKSPQQIFREFEDVDPELHIGRGDVKYHLGHSSDWVTAGGQKVHLSLCFNPSHLEFINPVALGRMRAKQDRAGDAQRVKGMVLLMHGDASFAGLGITQEILNLSELEAYSTGGTLHVIINNQVGFTTSPEEGRSSVYATDVCKMLQSPIFHVNGEDPEAVAQVVRLAMDFRMTFKRDVVIDMYGYRRRGHNEGDEPSFTQPLMAQAIASRPSVREGYLDHLLRLGGVSRDEAEGIAAERHEHLERALAVARADDYMPQAHEFTGIWKGYRGGPEAAAEETETGVDPARLSALLVAQTRFPDDFHPHPKIARATKSRLEMAGGQRPLDWSAAEALAFATLATEGHRVRLTGQDTARGTFSQRHAVLHDFEDGRTYVPLQHLSPDQAPVEIANSPLSEAGVLGFEYGYSLDFPGGLTIWEAQFGDFSNAAQVIIDQFIAGAEDKWHRLSGLVLFLPHGFEGQGPEHSSARLERFLTLAAEDNIQVVQPSTPAQLFHCLRRQALRRWQKPLVMMTPKSLLRHPRAISTLDDCASGIFQRVLAPNPAARPASGNRVILCSGKIAYELEREAEAKHRSDLAILRLEQPYPFPEAALRKALAFYPGAPISWVQEEPANMGAWSYLRGVYADRLGDLPPLEGVSRPASASPATGSAASHQHEQAELLARAMGASPDGMEAR